MFDEFKELPIVDEPIPTSNPLRDAEFALQIWTTLKQKGVSHISKRLKAAEERYQELSQLSN